MGVVITRLLFIDENFGGFLSNKTDSLRVAAPSLRFSFVRGSVRLHIGYKTDH